MFGNTPALTAEVLAAAARAGELACELPIIEDYRRFLDSEVADLINASNEPGDSVQAALFLREFVAGTPGSTSTSPAGQRQGGPLLPAQGGQRLGGPDPAGVPRSGPR